MPVNHKIIEAPSVNAAVWRALQLLRPASARAQGLAAPTDPFHHTGVKDPSAPLNFSFPDLDGRTVSLSDERFRGKVVVVAISGSWCPNCHDEAQYLVELYAKYHDKGLEIVALDFEEPEQQQDLATSEALKGAEADAIKEQKKASEIMAERLPGLTEPHPTTTTPASGQTPGNAQPGPDQATPATAAEPQIPKLLHPQHPDRFTPGATSLPSQNEKAQTPASLKTKPAPKSGAKPGSPANPPSDHSRENPQP